MVRYRRSGRHAFGAVDADEARITGDADITINVPTDAATVDDAVRLASEIVGPREGVAVVVNIESGHQIGEQITVESGYYGHITIQSEDAMVSVDGGSIGSTDHVLFVNRAVAPVLDCLVDMGNSGQDGVNATRNSAGIVTAGNGVVNAGRNGFDAFGSRFWINGTDFSGAANRGARIAAASVVSIQDADLSGAGDVGLRATDGCFVEAETVDASGCDVGALVAESSSVHLQGADLSDATGDALNVNTGGHVDATDVILDGAGSNGVRIETGGTGNLIRASIVGVGGYGVRMDRGPGRVVLRDATIDNPTDNAVLCIGGSINAMSLTVQNAADGVALFDGAEANLRSSTFSTITNNAVEITRVCVANLSNSTVEGSAIAAGDTNKSDLDVWDPDGIIKG